MTDNGPPGAPSDFGEPPGPKLPPFGPGTVLRILWRLALIGLLAWGIHLLIDWAMTKSVVLETSAQLRFGLLALMLLAYAVLIAVPFVPGVELGISLLMLQGSVIAPMVYSATLLGLVAAFLVGANVPYAMLHRWLGDLHMRRICALLARIEPLDRAARLEMLRARLPGWLAALVVRHRYVALALLINLPGNSVIGGGGGILLLAGLSRLFAVGAIALTMAIAVAPVPILVWLFDLRLPV
ncbi:MAG: hypothetical protein Q8P60_06570 [Pseudorhodobacter sp.]|nr:hypothetical protein [Pseudorhodobacter sp.]